MSYILDALRKADSDRERGAVPTLHSHTEHAAQSAGAGTGDRGMALRPLVWGGGVALLLVTAWLLLHPKDEPAVQSAALPPAAVPMQSPAPQPIHQPAAPPLTPTLVAPPPALEAAPVPAGTAPLAAAAAPSPVLKFSDLPDATRKAMPTIATSGAMYSDTPANRMLIVNGQLLHEGDKIAPELLLERIELKSAVLAYKGQRFRINY